MNEANCNETGKSPLTKVLSVDSDRRFTELLKENLEDGGRYEVRVENFPERALAVAREFRPDIVLLAIVMPRMPGLVVSEAIRNDPDLKDTPVVFLTAAVRKRHLEECGSIVANRPALAKPCSAEKIIEAIERYARRPWIE
jgi:two-component system, OmpR family, alkaline phosphatase synthesis response regulator PhoP